MFVRYYVRNYPSFAPEQPAVRGARRRRHECTVHDSFLRILSDGTWSVCTRSWSNRCLQRACASLSSTSWSREPLRSGFADGASDRQFPSPLPRSATTAHVLDLGPFHPACSIGISRSASVSAPRLSGTERLIRALDRPWFRHPVAACLVDRRPSPLAPALSCFPWIGNSLYYGSSAGRTTQNRASVAFHFLSFRW